MKKRLLFLFLPLMAIALAGVGFSRQALAFDPFRGGGSSELCNQRDSTGNASPVCGPNGTDDPLTGPNGAINKIANIFAFISGVAAVIIIVISGFEYIRSGGESAKISKAKNGILFAIIGLVVIALARAVVALVVSKL